MYQPGKEENSGEIAPGSSKETVPPQKTSRKTYSQDFKEAIWNMHKKLVEDNWDKPVEYISTAVKCPRSTVHKIVTGEFPGETSSTKKPSKEQSSKIHPSVEEEIRKTIYELYEAGVCVTSTMLLTELRRKEVDFPYGLRSLQRFLGHIGFKFRRLDRRMVLMDTERLRKMRAEYLAAIARHRAAGRPIVWLDETWIDTHDIPTHGWSDNTKKTAIDAPPSRGKRIIVLHAGGENGFVPNALFVSSKHISKSSADYHDDMCAETFEMWFEEDLLPNLPPHCVIVMDNASYHSRQIHKTPTMAALKDEMINFLKEKGVEVPNPATKTMLYDLIRSGNYEKVYAVDEKAKERGAEVLRLPPYHCIFNPIELIWAQLKSEVRARNTDPKAGAANFISMVREVEKTITAEKWKNCVRHVQKEEDRYRRVDEGTQELVINLDDSEEDDACFDIDI